jgi:peptidyl-prolyl cis-trans isomerase SurA
MRRSVPLLLLLLLAGATAVPAQTYLVNRIVLRVNDRIATLRQFQRDLGERRQMILAADDLDAGRRQELLAGAGRRVLADIYEELLLQSRAEQLALRVSEAEIDEAVASTRARMGLDDDEQFRQALQSGGIDEAMLRNRLRDQLSVQQVIGREVQSRVQVDEEELRRIWREEAEAFTVPAAVRLQDLVVLGEGRDPAAVAGTAAQIHAELVAGADIAELAKRYAAEGKTTAEVELGWVERGDLDPTLDEPAWQLPVGGLSAPIRGRGGIHILRVAERREPALRPFEDVKAAIESRERQRRMGEVYTDYLKELEQRSYIVMQVPPEAEGFRGLGEVEDELQEAAPSLSDAPPPAAAATAAAEASAGDLPEDAAIAPDAAPVPGANAPVPPAPPAPEGTGADDPDGG